MLKLHFKGAGCSPFVSSRWHGALGQDLGVHVQNKTAVLRTGGMNLRFCNIRTSVYSYQDMVQGQWATETQPLH